MLGKIKPATPPDDDEELLLDDDELDDEDELLEDDELDELELLDEELDELELLELLEDELELVVEYLRQVFSPSIVQQLKRGYESQYIVSAIAGTDIHNENSSNSLVI